jgi:hypothetical protein
VAGDKVFSVQAVVPVAYASVASYNPFQMLKPFLAGQPQVALHPEAGFLSNSPKPCCACNLSPGSLRVSVLSGLWPRPRVDP